MAERPAPPSTPRHRHRSLRIGGALVTAIVLVMAAAPWLAPYSPTDLLDVTMRRLPPGSELYAVQLDSGAWKLAERVERTARGLRIQRRGRLEEISAERVLNLTEDGVADRRLFLLGTDGVGRDLLSRILYGGRLSLIIGFLAVILALTLGLAVGSLAATGSRWLDGLLMRGVDAALAFPSLFLLITLAALFDTGTWVVALLIGGTAWMGVSRLARGEILGLRKRDFVLAARATGLGRWRILVHHLLPNAWGPLAVQAALLLVDVILVEAALSFLGMGVQPPTPTWGNMISDGRADLATAWWISTFPGIALAVTVISFNLLADGLRDVLAPRHDR
jgi:peptide/nickel transport system permease protein